MLKETKAISVFMLIILMLCSVVFGTLISYLWVMASYYNMPENATLLIVKDAVFPVSDARYFNVTILNPSNSISDVNITAIRLSVEGKDEVYDITATEPEPLPSLIKRGTEQTFKCKENWSNIAGETVRIEPVAANASTKSYLYTTPSVKLRLAPTFDVSRSIEYFNLTIENSVESVINLTLSEIMLFSIPINENVTPPLTPSLVLSPGHSETFKCNYNWENLMEQNATITVKTLEGYESSYTTNRLRGAILTIQEVIFDYTDAIDFYVNVSSSEDSTAGATVRGINLTLQDGTNVVINETFPPIGEPSLFNLVPEKESRIFKCAWNWTEYRNKTMTVKVYTNEGFTIPSRNETTPPEIVWDITDVKFDLDDVEHFTVNVTNMLCSLDKINVTRILLNGTATTMDPQFLVVNPGEQRVINCASDWKNFIGLDVNITVFREGEANVSKTVKITSVGLKLLGDNFVFGEVHDQYTNITIPYVNITISNSINSIWNVTLVKIIFETGNMTYEIDSALTYPKLAPNGYILRIGETITIVCFWDWTLYLGPNPIKVTVYTVEGFQASRTWYAPTP